MSIQLASRSSSYAQRLGVNLQLSMKTLKRFHPHLAFSLQVGPFVCRSAESSEDIKEIVRFRIETQSNSVSKRNIFIDEFDWAFDHLMIYHGGNQELVGTLRLSSTFWGQEPTNSKNFHLKNFLSLPGEKLELSRLRFRKEYHKPIVANLLWRALADVMISTKAQHIFGSVSLALPNPRQVALLYHYFSEQGRFHRAAFCPPQRPFSMENLDLWITSIKSPLTEMQKHEARALLSPLFEGYIKAGAYFGGEPAWDSETKCIDFLTILHRDDLNRALWRRFNHNSEPSID